MRIKATLVVAGFSALGLFAGGQWTFGFTPNGGWTFG